MPLRSSPTEISVELREYQRSLEQMLCDKGQAEGKRDYLRTLRRACVAVAAQSIRPLTPIERLSVEQRSAVLRRALDSRKSDFLVASLQSASLVAMLCSSVFAVVTRQQCLLPVRPRPFPDELLSSWIWRLAAANGLDYLAFCRELFSPLHGKGSWQFWDADRSRPDAIVDVLSRATAVPSSEIRKLSLWDYSRLFSVRKSDKIQHESSWLIPCIPNVKVQRAKGPQWCPACVREAPYVRRQWQMSFVTVCNRHQRLLVNRCSDCRRSAKRRIRSVSSNFSAQMNGLERCGCCENSRDIAPCPESIRCAVEFQNSLLEMARIGRNSISPAVQSSLIGIRIALGLITHQQTGSHTVHGNNKTVTTFERDSVYNRFDAITLLLVAVDLRLSAFLRICLDLGDGARSHLRLSSQGYTVSRDLRQLVDEIVVTIRPPSRGGFLDGPRPGFIDALDVLCNMLPLRHFGHSERSRTHRNRIIVAYMSNAGSAASSFPRWPEMLS